MNTVDKPNQGLLGYVSQVVLGAAIGQMLKERGFNPANAENHTTEVESALRALETLGIDTTHIADLVLAALRNLYIQPANTGLITDALARLLWEAMGDPESGPPPPVYLKAAYSMHNFYLCLLNPDFSSES